MIDPVLQIQIDKSKELLERARLKHETSDFDESERCVREVLLMLEVPSERNDLGEESDYSSQKYNLLYLLAHAYNRLNTLDMSRGDSVHAIEYAMQSLKYCERIADKQRMSALFGNLGAIYTSLANYVQALEMYSRAQNVAEEIGDRRILTNHLGNIGSVYFYLSDYARALDFYNTALEMSESLGDKVGSTVWLGDIGVVYEKLSDYPHALEYFTIALNSAELLGNKAGVALWLRNIGEVHLKMSDYHSAFECFGKALSLAEEIGNMSLVATLLPLIGLVFVQQKEYDTALEYLMRGLQLLQSLGMKSHVATVFASLGDLFANTDWSGHNDSRAEEHLLSALAIGLEMKTKHFASHQTLARLYKRQGRHAEAYEQLEKFYVLKDEVLNEEAQITAILVDQRRQIAVREKEIEIAAAASSAELNATRGLLDAVLPTSIASRMIAGEETIADYYPNVSILFADIVGFTAIATEVSPGVVIDFLNFVFSAFDEIIERHGCEKIKTIGDGYMAIAGAPIECADHAERIARAAVEMQKDIVLPDELRKLLPKNVSFNIRIGIHTGMAVCGVIGKKRFVWDVYSDAVNTASRMESNGEPGKIHVTKEFSWLLDSRQRMTKTAKEFVLEERGEIEIKGKGLMRTYFLEKQP